MDIRDNLHDGVRCARFEQGGGGLDGVLGECFKIDQSVVLLRASVVLDAQHAFAHITKLPDREFIQTTH